MPGMIHWYCLRCGTEILIGKYCRWCALIDMLRTELAAERTRTLEEAAHLVETTEYHADRYQFGVMADAIRQAKEPAENLSPLPEGSRGE